jgi:UDPglucose--hexose-1-phosphate uridylyltransferase
MAVTTEIRHDRISGRYVIVDRAPTKRRDDFQLEAPRLDDAPAECPLCEGREADAGTEVLAWRDGGSANVPGWSVRVVPNRHPLLRIEGEMEVRDDRGYETRDGLGAHEVVIETPVHDQPLHALDTDRLWRVLWAWRTRMQDLKRDGRFTSIVIFKNHGRAAGVRLDHAHSQVMAFPFVPPELAQKIRGAAGAFETNGRCAYCDVVARELEDGGRVIAESAGMLAFAPYASRVPFETWLVPRRHQPRFEEAGDDLLHALASLLRSTLGGIDWALERPAYQLVLHSAPLTGEADAAFHWHVEILPRVTRYAGFEWASGMYYNPVTPEEAAAALRGER